MRLGFKSVIFKRAVFVAFTRNQNHSAALLPKNTAASVKRERRRESESERERENLFVSNSIKALLSCLALFLLRFPKVFRFSFPFLLFFFFFFFF